MQSFSTETKVTYINQLLQVGFNIIGLRSFVSPKAINKKIIEQKEMN